MNDARIEIAAYDYASAERLAQALGVSHVVAQVLTRRGLADVAAARSFLAAEARHPLSAFGGLRDAAERIAGHVARGARITIHGDYDVDGVSATAVLVRALRTLGADVDWYLPSRLDDGYGLGHATVARLAERGTDLLVTVDCAITAVDEVAAARASGIDVVVTDHHQPRADGRLPDAAIVHPGIGGYPCPELCAAGVAYKLAQALLEAAGSDPAAADADLDLVALATVADVVPLVDENRRLVRAGLRALAATSKPGLQALMEVARVDPSGLDAGAIGFRLAPRINAAGRLHRADAGLELLLTGDPARARAIAAELDAVNAERREVETRILFEAEAQVAAARGDGADPAAFVLAADDWHPGVIGIVASRVAERHHRPVVLIALDGDEGSGSGRSIPAFDLLAGLTAASDELTRYGGHRAAAGLTIARDRVDAFRAAFVAHAAGVLRTADLVRVQRVDAVASGEALHLDLAEELQRLAPFGMGNPEPALLVPSALLADPRAIGEGRHVAFTLTSGGARSRCVAFGRGSALPAPAGEPVDAAVRLEVNHYNGAVEPRLILRHARPACPEPIEVVGEPAFEPGLLVELDRTLHAASGASSAGFTGKVAQLTGEDEQPVADGARRSLAAAATAAAARPAAVGGARAVRDVRNGGIAGLLCDLVASGEPVLTLTAHSEHRAHRLAARAGGFAITSWAAVADAPELTRPYAHLVALDPPPHARALDDLASMPGTGWAHLAWGDAEIAFARRVHEWELTLRPALTELYRALRGVTCAGGARLVELLRGAGSPPRTGAIAGRLVRVLAELELVTVDRDPLTVSLRPPTIRTELERSPAFRAYEERLHAGLAFLAEPERRAVAA